MTEKYTIRPIEEADNQALFELIQRILESYDLAKPGTAYFDPELGRLSFYYKAHKNAQYFVLTDSQGRVLGGVGIAPFTKGVCELQKIYLDENLRGQGLGKKLLKTALDFAKEHYQTVYLETHSTLKEACALYETCGFVWLDKPHVNSPHSEMDIWMQNNLASEEEK